MNTGDRSQIQRQLSQKHGGVAGHQMEILLARQRKQTHDVGRWPGHLDGLRCVRGRNHAETKLFELNIPFSVLAQLISQCERPFRVVTTQSDGKPPEKSSSRPWIAPAMSTMRFINRTLWTDVSPLADILLEDGSRSLGVERLR